MDFADRIRELAGRIPQQLAHIRTEEATKNALVMPFISALGYNVFDPLEVTPELDADVGVKKGEKVDYAILKEGKPIILFECFQPAQSLRGRSFPQDGQQQHPDAEEHLRPKNRSDGGVTRRRHPSSAQQKLCRSPYSGPRPSGPPRGLRR